MKAVFFCGKGGVGKSTMAAAAAKQLSRDSRVLAVSLDPAHNLGDIFQKDLSSGDGLIGDKLVLREIDLKELSRAYLEKEISVLSESYKYLQVLNLDRYFSVLKYSPGIEEYALLTGVEETIGRNKDFDYIVFDLPPTGLTLRFLALPRVTITWIGRLIQIRQKILERRHTIQKILGPLKNGERNPEEILDYDESGDEVLKRLRKLEETFRGLDGFLQGGSSAFVLVFNPDLLSMRESERLIEGFKDLNLPLRALVNNKVTEMNGDAAGEVERKIKALAGNLPLKRVMLSGLLSRDAWKLDAVNEDLTSLFSWESAHVCP
jgi:arsenite-transporting ATPase